MTDAFCDQWQAFIPEYDVEVDHLEPRSLGQGRAYADCVHRVV